MRRLLVALAVSAALAGQAQSQSQSHHQHEPAAAAPSAPLSDGLVKKVDPAAGEVVIQHGQLDSIGMPPMTMAFGVADKAWLGKLKVGDRIRFAAELKKGNPVVSRYEAVR